MGTKKFDKVIVVDIEATCWESKKDQGSQRSEIIEIGLCVLDPKSLDITRKNSYIVRPKHSEISKFCTSLTGHTAKSTKCGVPLGDACNTLMRKYGTKNRVWASWGDTDRLHFKEECSDKDAKYPFGNSHINVSDLFSLTMGESVRISVTNALKMIGLEFEGREHSGRDDAFNTARILAYLLDGGRPSHGT